MEDTMEEDASVLKRGSSDDASQPPQKRPKLSSPLHQEVVLEVSLPEKPPPSNIKSENMERPMPHEYQRQQEMDVGIIAYVNPNNLGFSGTLKQRYTDFLVNEIGPDGQVYHLTDLKEPKDVGTVARSAPEASAATPVTEPTKPDERQDGEFTDQLVDSQKDGVSETDILEVSAEDAALLEKWFGEFGGKIVTYGQQIHSKPNAKPASFGQILSPPVSDRQLRTQIHQAVRRIFQGSILTSLEGSGAMKFICGPRSSSKQQNSHSRNPPRGNGPQSDQPRGRLGWEQLGGEYLHFTLYKENRDTMEIARILASKTRHKDKDFYFAGTKDRRAVTVQRMSVHRAQPQDLARLNNGQLFHAAVGNFKFEKHNLNLGDLKGNEFLITLRSCRFPGLSNSSDDLDSLVKDAQAMVDAAAAKLKTDGYINYFGLQRFGTHEVSTDKVGMSILQGNFEEAVNMILAYKEDMAKAGSMSDRDFARSGKKYTRDDMNRALGISKFQNGDIKGGMDTLPHRFAAEFNIMRHLSNSANSKDFAGAIVKVPWNLKIMYPHAYQSLVWNHVATKRWSLHGSNVIQGDLVLVEQETAANPGQETSDDLDQNGEVVIRPAAHDAGLVSDDIFQRARALSLEEANSGKYNIFDVILPLPGFDIAYPENGIGDYYKEFMGSEAGGYLDPANMRRPRNEFSLSGSYRKLMSQVIDISGTVHAYNNDDEQFVETDLEKLTGKSRPPPLKSDPNGGISESTNSNGKRASSPQADPSPESVERAAKMNAWKNLPGKLEADEKADRERRALERAAAINSSSPVRQAKFKETFIQTSGDSGKRTGVREKNVLASSEKSEGGRSVSSGSDSDKDGGVPIHSFYSTSGSFVPTGIPHIEKASLPSINNPASVGTQSDPTPLNSLEYTFWPPSRLSKPIESSASSDHSLQRKSWAPVIESDYYSSSDKNESNINTEAKKLQDPFVTTKNVEIATKAVTNASTKSIMGQPNKLVTEEVESSPVSSSTGTPAFSSNVGIAANLPNDMETPTKKTDHTLSAHHTSQTDYSANASQSGETKLAVVLKLQLGSSQYATMALRELMKQGGVETYVPKLSTGPNYYNNAEHGHSKGNGNFNGRGHGRGRGRGNGGWRGKSRGRAREVR